MPLTILARQPGASTLRLVCPGGPRGHVHADRDHTAPKSLLEMRTCKQATWCFVVAMTATQLHSSFD